MEVYLVVYDRQTYEISRKLFSDIKAYIDDNYVQEQAGKLGLGSLRLRPGSGKNGARLRTSASRPDKKHGSGT